MPEFLVEFMQDLNNKSERIKEDFENTEINKLYEKIFRNYWNSYTLEDCSPLENVIAVDGSRGSCPTFNGGFLFVSRALALGKELIYKEVYTDFEFSDTKTQVDFIGRVMEWCEHSVAIKAIKDGFKGYILLDGSIYGRLAHIPLELKVENNKGFMIQYFHTIIELLDLCKQNEICLIGISKESRTAFFREFLLKELLKKEITDVDLLNRLLSSALNNPRDALTIAESINNKKVLALTEELIARKPDSLLILNNALDSGHTTPLLLGATQRRRRERSLLQRDINNYISTYFPLMSRDDEFRKKAAQILTEMLDFPAIVSFHLLPTLIDTPIRVDIPAWYLGMSDKLLDVGWPEVLKADISNILTLLSSGYCGLDNYNVWLSAVDNEVKLSRKDFEDLYLKKFEEIIGKKATPRGYRRVRYP